MMNKQDILSRIKECGLIAVVRAQNSEQAVKITEACIEGGVAAIYVVSPYPWQITGWILPLSQSCRITLLGNLQ
jgi:dihydrodipicolinate synthase/N-acetylneuraminate lyase